MTTLADIEEERPGSESQLREALAAIKPLVLMHPLGAPAFVRLNSAIREIEILNKLERELLGNRKPSPATTPITTDAEL